MQSLGWMRWLLVAALLAALPSYSWSGCGDGAVEAGEECDDSNVISGDGCSDTCVFEGCPLTGTWDDAIVGLRWVFIETGPGGAFTGLLLTTNPPFAVVEFAGVRTERFFTLGAPFVNVSGYQASCDTFSLSGLSIPIGQSVTRTTTVVCGNGVLEEGEDCDDGNFVNGDDCTVLCRVAGCGDAILGPGEECDDGNNVDGDGCSALCKACGNGSIDPGEQCDDGNRAAGDGCTSRCQLQECGNAAMEEGEECDDGNLTDGDGCAGTCRWEGCSMTGTWEITSLGTPVSGYVWRFIEDSYGAFISVLFSSSDPATPQLLSGSRVLRDVYLGGGSLGFQLDCDHVQFSGGSFVLARLSNSACGDGYLDTGEECDDGNWSNTDTCSAGCEMRGCGDHILDPGEDCDDGDTEAGDCCSATCTYEPEGSMCTQDDNACTTDACNGTGFCSHNSISCIDGNACTTDSCQPSTGCAHIPTPPQPCSDGDPCTRGDICGDGVCQSGAGCSLCERCIEGSGCWEVPRLDCSAPSKSLRTRLKLRNASSDRRDELLWRWKPGHSSSAEFGNPTTSTAYGLCVYDESGSFPLLRYHATIQAGGECGSRPCWETKPSGLVRYKNRAGGETGITEVSLHPGESEDAKVIVRGKGVNLLNSPGLSLAPPLPVPLRVQLQAKDAGCWDARYLSAGLDRNDEALFKGEAGSPSGAFDRLP